MTIDLASRVACSQSRELSSEKQESRVWAFIAEKINYYKMEGTTI